MAAPTPNFKSIPNELIDLIFNAYLTSFNLSPHAMLDDANLLVVAIQELEKQIRRAVRITRAPQDHITTADFKFGQLIQVLSADLPILNMSSFKNKHATHLKIKAALAERTLSLRVLHIDLQSLDIRDLADALALFHRYDIVPRYTIIVLKAIHWIVPTSLEINVIYDLNKLAGVNIGSCLAFTLVIVVRNR